MDCGIVINPLSARNQIEGGIVDGVGHATYSALTFEDGKPQQENFDTYRLIRNVEAPKEIETFGRIGAIFHKIKAYAPGRT